MGKRINYRWVTHISVVIFLWLMVPNLVSAQYESDTPPQKSTLKSHLYFGGGFGLQFGSVTLVEVSPLVGYMITPKLSVGLSPTYKYYNYKDYYGNVSTNVYGGSIFTRYSIFENVFAHIEYESLFYNTQSPGYQKVMQQFNSFFVGGGYNQRIGANSGMYILMLWNLNDTPNSPYVNPVIRIGFSVGL
jgi:hypothetical protein